jgi:predicted PurR-regulated permease PerM
VYRFREMKPGPEESAPYELGRPGPPYAVFALGGLIAALWFLRGILAPLTLAFVLAYALDPWVSSLERRRVNRRVASAFVMSILVAALIALVFWGIPSLVEELRLLSANLPGRVAELERSLAAVGGAAIHLALPHNFDDVRRLAVKYFVGSTDAFGSAVGGAVNVVGVAGETVVVLLLALYFLVDLKRIVEGGAELVPRRWFRSVRSSAMELQGMLSGYARGQLTANVVLGALYSLGLHVAHVPLALAIGVISGMLSFVPYVGFLVGLALAIVVAFLAGGGITMVFAAFAVMTVVHFIDVGYITPRIVGRSVGLEPVEVIVALVACGAAFGFLGLLFAVPIGASFKVVLRRLRQAYMRSHFYLHRDA